MQEPEDDAEPDRSTWPRVAVAVPAFLTLLFGVFPGIVLGLLDKAAILRW